MHGWDAAPAPHPVLLPLRHAPNRIMQLTIDLIGTFFYTYMQ